MKKIVTLDQAIIISKDLRAHEKSIVLVGGCFDIIHKGHRAFLTKAKKQGDYLFIALESDENVKRLKGKNRPINNQQKRAELLSGILFADYICMLPPLTTDKEYFTLTKILAPDVIAITKGDPKQQQKEQYAKAIGAKLAVVTNRLEQYATSKIINHT